MQNLQAKKLKRLAATTASWFICFRLCDSSVSLFVSLSVSVPLSVRGCVRGWLVVVLGFWCGGGSCWCVGGASDVIVRGGGVIAWEVCQQSTDSPADLVARISTFQDWRMHI